MKGIHLMYLGMALMFSTIFYPPDNSSVTSSWVYIFVMLLGISLSYAGFRTHKKHPEYLISFPRGRIRKTLIGVIIGAVAGCVVEFSMLYVAGFSLATIILIILFTFLLVVGLVWFGFRHRDKEIEQEPTS